MSKEEKEERDKRRKEQPGSGKEKHVFEHSAKFEIFTIDH